MTAPGGLLAVHAHPDDETLSTGALLATWAIAGSPVCVVTCTRGERGEVIGQHLEHLARDRAGLAQHREGEFAAALAALGVRDHLFLDTVAGDSRWSDSGMVWASAGRAAPAGDAEPGAFTRVDVGLAAGSLAQVIRDRRPEVVVGYEPGGGYGHPDHIHAHRVMMRAVELACAGPGGWSVPCVLWAATDADALRAGRRVCVRLAGPGLVPPDPDGPVPSAAVGFGSLDVTVPVRPVLDRVLTAMRAHATQVQAVAVGEGDVLATFALSDAVVQPLLADEVYRLVRGRSTGGVRWPQGIRVR